MGNVSDVLLKDDNLLISKIQKNYPAISLYSP